MWRSCGIQLRNITIFEDIQEDADVSYMIYQSNDSCDGVHGASCIYFIIVSYFFLCVNLFMFIGKSIFIVFHNFLLTLMKTFSVDLWLCSCQTAAFILFGRSIAGKFFCFMFGELKEKVKESHWEQVQCYFTSTGHEIWRGNLECTFANK